MTDYELIVLVIMIVTLAFSIHNGNPKGWLYNKSWGKEQKSGQSKPNQVK